MLPRTLLPRLVELSHGFPAIFLTGPRQSGKTTLVRGCFPEWPYRSLEDLQVREEAQQDPRGFLARFEGAPGLVLDEAQHAAPLFSYLQGFLDERRIGPVILTGSQNLQLSMKVSQSLAGRAAILELLPFSRAELTGRPARTPAGLAAGWSPVSGGDALLDRALFVGGYPPIHDRGLDPRAWHDAYLRTYVERDVRTLANIGDLATFVRFMRLCAGRVGQLLNSSALAADAGVDHTTARRWLSILEASYVVRLLPPHFRNFSKRVVKAPKLYFLDPGLACGLLGIRSEEDLATHPLRGALVECLAFTELEKLFCHHGERPPLYFWRDHAGHEVDFLVELGGRVVPIEVKSAATVPEDAFAGLRRYTRLAAEPGGVLVYGGSESYGRGGDVLQSWDGVS